MFKCSDKISGFSKYLLALSNYNKISPQKKQFYFNYASHLKEFDAALTLESERLKKDALKEKEKKTKN